MIRTFFAALLFLTLTNLCFGQDVLVSVKNIKVTPGKGNELTDTYRWSQDGKSYVLFANGALESESGKKLRLPISKGDHVSYLFSGTFRNDLVVSFDSYSGGYGTFLLCLVKVETHTLKWCRSVSSQVVGEYRAAPDSGLPLDRKYKVRKLEQSSRAVK
jgi:hypothetical protein